MTPPHDRLVTEWIEKARHDFDTAERELQARGWPDIICFHCHQTVEKLLKAVLVAHRVDITEYRVHDLPHLLDACLRHNDSLTGLRAPCQSLAGYYIAARYPMGATYTLADARRAVTAARKVSATILRVLGRSPWK